MNVNGSPLSEEVFETKEELKQAFNKAIENEEVNTIKVTKNKPKMTEQRYNFIEKKLKKLENQYNTLVEELQKG